MSGRSEKELISSKKMQLKLKELPDIFSEFYYFMDSNMSYTTSERYIAYVEEFANYIDNECEIEEDFYTHITPTHLNKYFAQMRNKEVNGQHVRMSDSIRATKWSALNTFFTFLKMNGYIKENPMSKTTRPKVHDNPNVSYLTEEEIDMLLKEVNDTASEKMKNRDLALISLGVTTGLRVSALVQINVQDIDFNNNVIRVIEKRGKVCDTYFGENTKKRLLLWLQDRKKYFSNVDTDALFVSNRNTRLSRFGVGEILDKYTKNITDKNVTPHVMRHSCATNLYEKTGDIYLCASVLNHANVATTQRYADISKEKKRSATNILDSMG